MYKVKDIKQDFSTYGIKNSLNYYRNKDNTVKKSWQFYKYYYFKNAYYDGRMLDVHSKWYKNLTGRNIDFRNLETFSDKLQWIKIFEQDERKKLLSDKLEAKKWASDLLGEKHIPKTLRVWNNFDEIDFKGLPDNIVLKFSHGSGLNFFIDEISKNGASEKELWRFWPWYNFYFTLDYSFFSVYEMLYHLIKPRFYAEELIKDIYKGDYCPDYKFFCAEGKIKLFSRFRMLTYIDEIYTQDLKYKIEEKKLVPVKHIKELPKNYDEMLRIVSKLCKGFNFVRVDLLTNDKEVYFGEMTFTPLSGILDKFPKDIDKDFADRIIVEDAKTIF